MTIKGCNEVIKEYKQNLKNNEFYNENDEFKNFVDDFFKELRNLDMTNIPNADLGIFLNVIFKDKGRDISQYSNNFEELFMKTPFRGQKGTLLEVDTSILTRRLMAAIIRENEMELRNVTVLDNLLSLMREHKEFLTGNTNYKKSARF